MKEAKEESNKAKQVKKIQEVKKAEQQLQQQLVMQNYYVYLEVRRVRRSG